MYYPLHSSCFAGEGMGTAKSASATSSIWTSAGYSAKLVDMNEQEADKLYANIYESGLKLLSSATAEGGYDLVIDITQVDEVSLDSIESQTSVGNLL